ncbi:MAG: cytochrome c oxidase accessory protein CcoG [Rhodospirillales bacterium]|jgi:cytochrome c oxidase accessory protein FixG|nr:cytochrome c oxidase accessory protein CcoG [Rhodospirillales bacterium]MBT4038759.1 cytochrome c oxidase accessory protein CcoG [Rhodospirillales bacterium]MBT4627334.1 cytochrome c oxidase accessory protein CcoG [Rhodospirillales bacterium]MBT5353160.1 cytochrome c oxidase accessory protein CcoG [Rhodospirillales bacterium]MBT5521598.1 cytochrome c oxidase accessory protein CcoG [Rhodospirillales bacterium]
MSHIEQYDVKPVNKKEERNLYKKRVKIHPKRVNGTFRSLKWGLMIFTLGIYYVTPWLRWDRGPGAPDQAVLIDFPARRFYFFFIEIWPQEIYYLAGLLIIAGIGLFLVTSLVGRAWCGYACPQTVWTDLFLVVERFVEGDRAARIRLDKAPISISKATKKIIKFGLWTVISIGTGGAWVFYYADAPTLAMQLINFDAPTIAYATIGVLSFTTLTLGGLMREQVCTYMCPWPRIQAVMMDEESMTVTYRSTRGEPRSAFRKGDSWDQRGDCVDCKACVVACPMGIDIRDGQQMECITCALCIDACDNIMEKVGRPRGLIAYDSLANADRRAKDQHGSIKFIRGRTLVYAGVLVIVAAGMLAALLLRSDLDINVLHDRNPLFTALSNGDIRNGFTFKILNKSREQRTFSITAEGIDDLSLKLVGSEDLNDFTVPYVTVKPDRLQSFRLLATVPASAITSNAQSLRLILTEINTKKKVTYSTMFRGPEK